ncbi:hypothetical protein GCM10023084_28650 [Streptomyces lacrimifluminis]|uniref:Uncharacterized protein n=1 Tax=Streptomyces lacrimifluminis TaxID=1500077 RepID=A0A917NTV2_9ACTN|nr:hypothetical protein GCM10012282_25270 [Streptomyces lacrimifluminis]
MAYALLAAGVARCDRVGSRAVVNTDPAYRAHKVVYVLRQAGVSVLLAALGREASDCRAMADEVRAS